MNRILTTVLVGVAATFLGCGKSTTYQSGDSKLTVSEDGDTAKYEVTTKDGKATFAASDTAVAIPDTFPKDVPIPKGAVAKLAMTQGTTEVLHLLVQGGLAEVAKDYQDKLKGEGWEIETTMNMGEGSMIQAKKDKRTCGVMVLTDDSGTMVQLTVSAK